MRKCFFLFGLFLLVFGIFVFQDIFISKTFAQSCDSGAYLYSECVGCNWSKDVCNNNDCSGTDYCGDNSNDSGCSSWCDTPAVCNVYPPSECVFVPAYGWCVYLTGNDCSGAVQVPCTCGQPVPTPPPGSTPPPGPRPTRMPGDRVVGGVTKDGVRVNNFNYTIASSDNKPSYWIGSESERAYGIGNWENNPTVTITLTNPDLGYTCSGWNFNKDPDEALGIPVQNGLSCSATITIGSGGLSPDWQNHLWFNLVPTSSVPPTAVPTPTAVSTPTPIPPQPTIIIATPTPPICATASNPYTGSGININWPSVVPPITYVDISSNNFSLSYYNFGVPNGVTSVTAPNTGPSANLLNANMQNRVLSGAGSYAINNPWFGSGTYTLSGNGSCTGAGCTWDIRADVYNADASGNPMIPPGVQAIYRNTTFTVPQGQIVNVILQVGVSGGTATFSNVSLIKPSNFFNGRSGVSGPLAISPNIDYSVRLYNGFTNSATPYPTFKISACPTPPTSNAWMQVSGDVHTNK